MRPLFKSLFLLTALVGVLVPLTSHSSATAQETVPRFEPADCMFDLPAGVVEGTDVQCGYVVVPEEHAKPDGDVVKLAVAIIKSFSDTPAPDPLFMAQGGPGGSTIDYYSSIFLGGDGNAILEKRDVVLFDQRGTFYSEPFLGCVTEDDQSVAATIEKNASPEEENQAYVEAITACRDRLAEGGINFSAFDSVENAADVESIREALGYDEFNYYGVSYGTLLGQHVIRDQSAHLRSVILDANVPLSVNFVTEIPANTQEVFHKLFTTCANDPTCDSSYPDLENVFYDQVARLNEEPIGFPLTNPYTGDNYDALLTGDRLMNFTFQMMYVSFLIPSLPEMIYDVKNNDTTIIQQYAPFFLFDPTFADGMYYSTMCAEDSDFTLADQNTAGVRPEIAEYFGAESFLDVCKAWTVDQLGAYVDESVQSDKPVLLMNGEFDPITPPKWAELISQTLSNSSVVIFPGQGHGNFLDSPCATAIGVAFLDDPTAKPDTTCLKDMGIIFSVKSSGDFTDADGLFTFPIPGGWDDQSTADHALYVQTSTGSQIFVSKTPETDVDAVFEAFLADYQVDSSVEPEISSFDLPNGSWERRVFTLQDGTVLRILVLPTNSASIITGTVYSTDNERAARQALTLVVDGLIVTE